MRRAATFRLDADLLARARRYARAENRSLTNLVETLLRSCVPGDPAPECVEQEAAEGVTGGGGERGGRERDRHPEIDAALGRTALAESEGRLQFALRAGRLGNWELDLATQLVVASDTCLEILGLEPSGAPFTYDDIVARIHPADRLRQRQQLQKALDARSQFDVEYRVVAQDGDARWVQVRGLGIYDDTGSITHVTGVSLDVTARKHADERQTALLGELNHRVKNTLATIQALAMQTKHRATDQAGFTRDLDGRLAALARAHDLLSEGAWEGVLLSEILDRMSTLYDCAGAVGRFSLDGPAVLLSPNAAVTLNMAFHELGTNAERFGALSVSGGHVAVQWKMFEEAGARCVDITWREEGGPVVQTPAESGFGSRLLERGLPGELGGKVTLDFAQAGLLCQIRLPISQKVRLAA